MGNALQPEERRVVEAALRFANLRRIASAGQVEQLFAAVIDFREIMLEGNLTVDATALYVDAQREVRDWLERIARSEGGRKEVAREVAARFAEGVGARLSIRNRRLRYAFDIGSVPTACVLAVALLLDGRRGLENRVKRCRWSRCNGGQPRFNVDLDPRGHPRWYCPGHKERHDRETSAKRVAQWRTARKEKQAGG
jgi:hypothetical protein